MGFEEAWEKRIFRNSMQPTRVCGRYGWRDRGVTKCPGHYPCGGKIMFPINSTVDYNSFNP